MVFFLHIKLVSHTLISIKPIFISISINCVRTIALGIDLNLYNITQKTKKILRDKLLNWLKECIELIRQI